MIRNDSKANQDNTVCMNGYSGNPARERLLPEIVLVEITIIM
jgi:hypothetical protein